MITLDVADYCSACMDFDPDVQRPQKAYGLSEEIVLSDTVIRCANRNRCKNIERYLRKKVTDDGVGKTGEAMPYPYIIEMICDWWAFSWIKGDLSEMFAWYKDHESYIKLHNNTRSIVEEILEMIRTKLTEVENAEN